MPLNVSTLYMNEISIIAGTGHTNDDVEAALDAASRGKLTMLIDRVMPLSQAAEAHRLVSAREITGKVLLTPDETLG